MIYNFKPTMLPLKAYEKYINDLYYKKLLNSKYHNLISIISKISYNCKIILKINNIEENFTIELLHGILQNHENPKNYCKIRSKIKIYNFYEISDVKITNTEFLDFCDNSLIDTVSKCYKYEICFIETNNIESINYFFIKTITKWIIIFSKNKINNYNEKLFINWTIYLKSDFYLILKHNS